MARKFNNYDWFCHIVTYNKESVSFNRRRTEILLQVSIQSEVR
jgi:hypothetical protein